jgi:hypothetical protein
MKSHGSIHFSVTFMEQPRSLGFRSFTLVSSSHHAYCLHFHVNYQTVYILTKRSICDLNCCMNVSLQ